MEDIQNPDFACKNLFRISKNGYETPSPIVEIQKILMFSLANSYRIYTSSIFSMDRTFYKHIMVYA